MRKLSTAFVIVLMLFSLFPSNIQGSYVEFSDLIKSDNISESVNYDLATYEDYVYLGDTNKISIFNTPTGKLTQGGEITTGGQVDDLVINSTLMFVTVRDVGIQVFDLTIPDDPQLLKTINSGGNSLVIQGNYLFSIFINLGFEI